MYGKLIVALQACQGGPPEEGEAVVAAVKALWDPQNVFRTNGNGVPA